MFSVAILQREIHLKQWVYLVLLLFGVAIIHLDGTDSWKMKELSSIGLVSILSCATLSSFVSVFLEKRCKESKEHILLWNIQLSVIGTCFSYIYYLADHFHTALSPMPQMFFFGFDSLVWLLVCIQACGGLLVACVLKYSDSIEKNFATSCGVVLSCLATAWIFSIVPTVQFCAGTLCVFVSTHMYSKWENIVSTIINVTRAWSWQRGIFALFFRWILLPSSNQ